MRISALAILAVVTACGGSGSPTGPGGPGGVGTFTATIDGSNWVSTMNQVVGGGSGPNQVPGLITITGTQVVSAANYTNLTLFLGYIGGTGTYPLGVNHGTTAGGGGLVTAPQGSSVGSWSTNLTGAAGTVTVTSLTTSRIAGTFQFTAPPQSYSQTTGTRVVTNGKFDMPLPAGFTAAPANDRGSRIAALINGASWNGATVTALGSQTVFVLGGLTDSLSISISPTVAASVGGTYPLGGVGNGTVIVTRVGTSNSWSSGVAGSVGSLTIASLGNGRATGTFTATLIPGAGTTGNMSITQGTFDVKIISP